MNEGPILIFGIFIGFIAGGLIIGTKVDSHADDYWHRQAIAHSCAHYDSVTADFKWNTKPAPITSEE